ncbi:MAG: tape measure protein [Faecousia sp.]
MANQVVIDVEARFLDNVSGQTNSATSSFKDLEKSAKSAAKEVDNLGKKEAEPTVDADNSRLLQKVNESRSKLSKLGNTKTEAKLSVLDKASQIIEKVASKAKAFGNKTYSALVKIRGSNALSSLNKISTAGQKIAGKTWTTMVKIKDMATAPLRGIKNMLFSIKSLVLAITAGLAAKQFIINPLNLADAYSSSKIGFSTLLGESQGQQMMNALDEFAKKTPFNTSNVISNAQKMMAMGWDAENIISDMEVIGNAAAATGNLDQGLESIVRALSQIKTKGRLSTEELNQLAEAGIAAKAMLAEQMGYGTGDEGIAKMTEDLEKGAIASNEAIAALLAGMKKYDGMMDSMANETASGLMSQIQDVFEINVARKWGQGLQDGAKRGLGTVVKLLDEAEEALASFGDMMYEIGETASNWLADKLENAVKRITDITGTFEFKNASLGEKISMLWNGVIVDPLKEWWEGGGQQKTAETAGKIGGWIGEMLTKGLLALFGATDILDEGIGENQGASIAGSFLQGFLDNFDGSAITDAFVDAIGNVWGALPTWAKFLIGGYGIGKAAGGISSFAGGIVSAIDLVKGVIGTSGTVGAGGAVTGASGLLGLIGKTGVAGVGSSGILGGLANTGYALMGGTSALSVGGGTAALVGASGIAGGVAGLAATGKGIYDLYGAYKANKAGDKIERDAKIQSGGFALGGVATGAAIGAGIGSVVPVIGTALGGLVGAGIGGIAGWFMGGKAADDIRAAKYESEEMQEAIKDSNTSAEELAQTFEKAKWENATKHFGDIKLSMSEIQRLAEQIVWGDDLGNFEQFSSATKTAENSLQSLKTAAEQTNRWMWKAGLGVKFNDDEIESIKKSFDDYINSAKSYVENKHYEFTAAVSMLVDVNSDEGKSILESGNAFYGQIQEKLNNLGSELSSKVEIALEDGVITLDEQAEITNLQQQIAEITQQIANAEQDAKLELIKIKFGNGNLDYESFEKLMSQMQTTIEERMSANDDAFVCSVSNLNLQLEQGAISQEEYDSQLQTIIDGYNSSNAKLRADIQDVELNIIGDAYADVLGDDAVANLNNALQYAIDNGLDPVEISDQKMADLLHINLDGNGETVSNIKDMLSGVFDQLGLIPVEVDGELLFKVKEGNNVEEQIKSTLPETVESTVGVDISGEKNIQNTIDILAEDFGIPPEHAATVALLLTGDKELLNKIDVSQLAKEFGIPESQAKTIIEKLTGSKSIENRLEVLAGDFGIPDSISKTISVNIKAIKGKVESFVGNLFGGGSGKGSGYRGGIFGGESAMDAFARGGETDNSGIVGGSTRFIRVNEESPEMIIPLSSQRRERALKLWNKTGELLNVPGFSRGGGTSGGQDEGIRFMHNDSYDSSVGRSINITFGDINFTIQVSGNDKESIIAAIKAQAGEIADYLVGIIADELADEFENTPLRGGVA